MLVRITASDQVLEQFCYLPLVYGEIYEANYSKIDNVEYKSFYDVIFDKQTIVRGVHELRLQELKQPEIREFRINKIINC